MNTSRMPKGTFGLLSSYLHQARSQIVSRYIVPGDVVLDVGCGTGDFAEFLPKRTTYYGIDPRQLWDDEQKNLFIAKISDPLPKAIKNPITAVVSLAVIEHLLDPESLFKYAHDILPVNGKLIITTPHPIARKVHDTGATLGLFSKNASDDHETFLDRDLLESLGKKQHFTMTHYQRFLFFMNQVAVFSKSGKSR